VEIDLTGLVLPEKVETVHTSDERPIGHFVVEPLERGYGHTLGNSVRRVLLSSLRGSAVWAFRINGVVHEHQTVEGVVEDVHQVIQNLKSAGGGPGRRGRRGHRGDLRARRGRSRRAW
jgi:DNA-directed RNA polymerase subunit alpha